LNTSSYLVQRYRGRPAQVIRRPGNVSMAPLFRFTLIAGSF